jgi:HipA-like protein
MALKNWASRLGGYKNPPPTLIVYYKSEPVAELKKENGKFAFRYFSAFFTLNLSPLPGLPAGNGQDFLVYDELPAFFRERLPDTRRPEIKQWILRHQVDESNELRMLSELGAHSITDSFELKLSA